MVQQFIHGTQYIDELVMMRRAGHGDLYVHQDANWNVIGATDLNGQFVERYEYTPYGELTVHQETGSGDYDGDQDVDSTDRAAIEAGGDCLGGTPPAACRVLDLDFDGDYDSADATLFDALDQGYMTHPGRRLSSVNQPFAHQGLVYEPEVAQYQNRARQYDPTLRRFMQRDALALGALPGAGFHDGPNLYNYVRNNPVSGVDPSGAVFARCGTVNCQCPSNFRYNSVNAVPIYINTNMSPDRAGQFNPFFWRIEIRTGRCCDLNAGRLSNTIDHECIHACQYRHYGFLQYSILYQAEALKCLLRGLPPYDPTCNALEWQAQFAATYGIWFSWGQRPGACSASSIQSRPGISSGRMIR
jgi:RHS repeat-associated protein